MTTRRLRPDQVSDLACLIKDPRWHLLGEPGTGKTPTICLYFYWAWRDHQRRSVWVMPKSLMLKNRDELKDWTPFSDDEIVVLEKDTRPLRTKRNPDPPDAPIYMRPRKVRDPKTKKLVEAPGEPAFDLIADTARRGKVLVCNFKFFTRHWQRIVEHWNPIALAADESHKAYGGHDSETTRQLFFAQVHIPRIHFMSGTLINGRLDTAYPAITLANPNYYPGGYQSFRNEHAGVIDDYDRVVFWTGTDKVKTILKQHGSHRTLKELFGVDHPVPQKIVVEMSEDMRAAYQEFHDKAILELEDRFLDGTMGGGVHAIRARQLMECPEIFGLDYEIAKDEVLALFFEEALVNQGPLVVYTPIVPQQERLVRLATEAGLDADLMNGNVPLKGRARIDEAFRAGKLNCVIANPAVADVGFNWGHVDHFAYPALDYLDGNFVQSYMRGLRGVRTRPLRVSVLQYARSIDQRIAQIVREKSQLAHDVDEGRQLLVF